MTHLCSLEVQRRTDGPWEFVGAFLKLSEARRKAKACQIGCERRATRIQKWVRP